MFLCVGLSSRQVVESLEQVFTYLRGGNEATFERMLPSKLKMFRNFSIGTLLKCGSAKSVDERSHKVGVVVYSGEEIDLAQSGTLNALIVAWHHGVVVVDEA